ncbi:tetratricopeptide repeat protein [Myroides sp. LJL119]
MHFDNEDEEYRLALSRFESMLKSNRVLFFDSEEFEAIVLHYLDSGKINLAKKALKLGEDQHPNSVGLKLVKVEILIFEHKYEIADRLLNTIQEMDPTNEEVFIQRATILSKLGDHNKAIEFLKIALTLTQDLADVYSLMAMEYLLLDEIEQAKKYFMLCLDQDLDDQTSLYNIVYCFDFLGQTQQAIDYLSEYIEKKPYSEIAWHQLGREYMSLKDFEKAVWAFDYATLIDEHFVGAYLEKGKSLENLEQYDQALQNYMITLDLDDATSYVLLRIGKCHQNLNNIPKANEYFKRAVHEDPLLDKAWIALCDIALNELDYEKALFYLQKAIDIDEQRDSYWGRYAVINKCLLNFEQAQIGYQKAAELGNNLIELWVSWADSLYILGDYTTAIARLLQISELHNSTAGINARLAVLYYTIGDNHLAENYLNQALSQDINSKDVLKKYFHHAWESTFFQNIIRKFENR